MSEQNTELFDSPLPSDETIRTVLTVTADADCTDMLFWSTWHGGLRVFVLCSDFFQWACSDVEEITDQNVQSFVDTFAEVAALTDKRRTYDAALLWCARNRGMRPQGPYYEHLNPSLHHLFDAAGPEREIGMGNPGARSTPPGEQGPGERP